MTTNLIHDWFHGTEAPHLTRLIVERLREAGISCVIATTGGGCMAVEGELPGDKSWSLTDADANLPGHWTAQNGSNDDLTGDKGEVWLGRYTDTGEADYDTDVDPQVFDMTTRTVAYGEGWWSTSAITPRDIRSIIATLKSWGA